MSACLGNTNSLDLMMDAGHPRIASVEQDDAEVDLVAFDTIKVVKLKLNWKIAE